MSGGWLVVEAVVVVAIVAATVTLTVLLRRGSRQIDTALAQVFDLRDAETARSNVRRLRSHEVHAAVERARRRHPSGGAS